ncbi:hypothetical protein MLD38_025445 [Melastoma candidum]|uniref:Uncharacterized protein n=1 Tax=Melastoma candidum TaxID=119954 RepID=A0ACB9NX62_9MYRT|nr:hypothetical protein MLD38_025445 [Melastoma candidum]
MDPRTPNIVLLLAVLLLPPATPLSIPPKATKPANPTSSIAVAGVVYCDVCSTGTFSRYSYFLPGADVNIRCKFKASGPETAEQIDFSVNRTTDRYGVYRLEIPSVDGVDCIEGRQVASACQATLLSSSSPACNVPGLRTTTDEISVKSKQQSLCIFSLNALSYQPRRKNVTFCGPRKYEKESLPLPGAPRNDFDSPQALNSSKFFLPYFPPYGLPWAPIPQLPIPFPQLPPFPSISLPPLPPLPRLPFPSFPFQVPPSSPSPLFQFPPFPPMPPSSSDPRTWIPGVPFFGTPPPSSSSSSSPFNPWDPRSWIPYFPPYSPPGPQDHTP